MKKLILVCAVSFISISSFAQTDSKMDNKKMDDKNMDHKDHSKMNHSMKDCVMMKDGKMMMMKDGKMMMMNHDMTMSNGTKCITNGECIMKDGTKMMMKNGECMDMNGKMMPIKDSKDSKTMYLVPDSKEKKGY